MNDPTIGHPSLPAVMRARRALPCLVLRRSFYDAVVHAALSSKDLASRSDRQRLLFHSASADQLEDDFIWLIRLGVLRREVDGQGLTERVRLTPLGREVLQAWPGEIPQAAGLARLRGWWRRHRPRL